MSHLTYVFSFLFVFFFFSSRRRHTRCLSDWSSDVCSSDLAPRAAGHIARGGDVRARLNAFTSLGALVLALSCAKAPPPDAVERPSGEPLKIGRASCRESV